ncbi:hypothetical protein IHE44_0004483 [Lamprotornis superbus]|uniref:Uncharacterized protein n=1 Tax=Lamprotornis superbus TaxID=245042 RepID=A0A835NNS3_9PASS|nr:hypothetical protein IHE44_0004483 [Lamprotornis superbus]
MGDTPERTVEPGCFAGWVEVQGGTSSKLSGAVVKAKPTPVSGPTQLQAQGGAQGAWLFPVPGLELEQPILPMDVEEEPVCFGKYLLIFEQTIAEVAWKRSKFPNQLSVGGNVVSHSQSAQIFIGSPHIPTGLCHGPSPAQSQDAGIAPEAMDAHVDLLTELQLLDKVPTLERLRAAQKRRAQQLKKWAQYEKEMQHKKRKHEKKRNAVNRKKVSFEASVALLEASLRNDVEEDLSKHPRFYKQAAIKSSFGSLLTEQGREHAADMLVAYVSRQSRWGQWGDGQ